MFSYRAYGLGIHSAIPLPELIVARTAADVVVRFGSVGGSHFLAPNVDSDRWVGSQGLYMCWKEAGCFLVRSGQEIIVEPVSDATEQVLRLCLLGPVLGALLHQRGMLVLHASAVVISDGVVAFLGESGEGKSTTAAALHARGYSIMADDIVALDLSAIGAPMVPPAFPRLKFSPQSAAALNYSLETLTEFHPEDHRREYRAVEGFPQMPLPLKAIYVLAEGTSLGIERLHSQEAFVELVRHSYAASLLKTVGATSAHFHQCVDVVKFVPIYRLRRQLSVAVLPEVAQLVEEQLLQ